MVVQWSRKYRWGEEHLGPVVKGPVREARWVQVLPLDLFTRVEAAQIWAVGLDECRRRLQALVMVGLLRRRGKRPADGLGLYLRVLHG